MSGHGGRRQGAGRKRGGLSKKTTEIARRAAAEGVTPLEVMLHVMRAHYDAGRYGEAAAVAKDAAPYVHPRLSAVAVGGGGAPVRLHLVEEIVAPGACTDGDASPHADGQAAPGAG